MNISFNRRSFLKGAAGAAAAAAGGCCCSGYKCPRTVKSGDKIRFGIIGAAGKGSTDWKCMFKHGEEIAAFCDVDDKAIDEALVELKELGGDPSKVRRFRDYREMLEKMSGQLDAVTVSTPDHMHAAQAIAAMREGLHVYVQKPLVRTLWEVERFSKAAKASGVITQMGNQGSSGSGMRKNVDLLNLGIIGDVTEVHVWTDRPIWPQGNIAKAVAGGKIVAPPSTLDWDLWLGTARKRPYVADRAEGLEPNCLNKWATKIRGAYHRFNWRGFYDFGTGAFGDMACHTFNLPFRGLELGRPLKAECKQIIEPTDIAYPLRSIVEVTYAARKSRVRPGVKLPEVKLYWYDGNQQPSAELMPQVVAALGSVPKTGCLIVGSKGIICSTNDYGQEAFIAFKDEKRIKSTFKHDACKAIAEYLPRRPEPGTEGQYPEFLDAIKGVSPVFADTHSRAFSDVEHSVPMLEGMLVGCVAQRVPGVLRWDSDNQIFDNAAANEFIRPHIRAGFEF